MNENFSSWLNRSFLLCGEIVSFIVVVEAEEIRKMIDECEDDPRKATFYAHTHKFKEVTFVSFPRFFFRESNKIFKKTKK